MHIAGRLALQSIDVAQALVGANSPTPDSLRQGYHGFDVVVRTLCEHSFEADLGAELPAGALVRLRLPGAGMMVAHVTGSHEGRLRANFVNPVHPSRLRKTLGYVRPFESAAA